MRPDVIRITSLFAAAAGMNDYKRIDEAIAVVVVQAVINRRIGGHGRVLRHDIGAWSARGASDAKVAIAIEGECLRKLERARYLSDNIHQSAGHFLVILLNAAVRQYASGE